MAGVDFPELASRRKGVASSRHANELFDERINNLANSQLKEKKKRGGKFFFI